jgi:hypothetical protein
MKKLLVALAIVMGLCGNADAANKFFGAICLTGGTAGCLDAIDGNRLSDMDGAQVITSTAAYFFTLDPDSGLAESSPDIIAPDDNAGNKRWILVSMTNSKLISYDFVSLASDETWNGDVITATAGENVSFGDICYLKSDGKFWLADANAENTTKGMIVMSTASISADASGVFLLRGLIRDDSWDWTVGADLWVPETPGNATETQPSDVGDFIRFIGWAKGADYIWFDPVKTLIGL